MEREKMYLIFSDGLIMYSPAVSSISVDKVMKFDYSMLEDVEINSNTVIALHPNMEDGLTKEFIVYALKKGVEFVSLFEPMSGSVHYREMRLQVTDGCVKCVGVSYTDGITEVDLLEYMLSNKQIYEAAELITKLVLMDVATSKTPAWTRKYNAIINGRNSIDSNENTLNISLECPNIHAIRSLGDKTKETYLTMDKRIKILKSAMGNGQFIVGFDDNGRLITCNQEDADRIYRAEKHI